MDLEDVVLTDRVHNKLHYQAAGEARLDAEAFAAREDFFTAVAWDDHYRYHLSQIRK